MNRIDRNSTKISTQIISILREQILSGKYPQDLKLPTERELAKEFGVSQPTIREAISALDAMGLLDVRHGSGAYVCHNRKFIVASALQILLQLESITLVQALAVRRVLGRYSVALASELATEAEMQRIEDALEALEDLEHLTSVSDLVNLLADFQTAVSEASHNSLLSVFESLLIQMLLYVQMRVLKLHGIEYWKNRSRAFHEDRKGIAQAIRSRDRDASLRAVEVFFEHQKEQFQRDPELETMCFSDQEVINAVSDTLINMRRSGVTSAQERNANGQ